jgi:isopenicillin-N N-acyltransferase-like protein
VPDDLESTVAARYLPFANGYAPELVEEMRGIAEGAGVAFEDVFLLNCFLDVYDAVFPQLADAILDGCTAFGVTAERADGNTVVAQNLDLRSFFGPAAVLLDVNPADAPRAIVLSVAGVVGCAGLNEAGIGLVFNKLAPTDAGPGVPYPMLARRALAQTRVGNAIHSIASPKRASGSHMLLGDCSSGVYSIESSADDYEISYADAGTIAHSNHYIAPRLQALDGHYKRYAGDSYVRLDRARRGIGSGVMGLDAVVSVARDHGNSPDSICRHRDENAPGYRQASTIASIITLPCEKRLMVASGPPCESEYVSISF